jgi:hypothetical protein
MFRNSKLKKNIDWANFTLATVKYEHFVILARAVSLIQQNWKAKRLRARLAILTEIKNHVK